MFENIKSKKSPVGIELINKGLITDEQLDKALVYQKEHSELKLGEVVDILDMCDKGKLLRVIGEKIGQKSIALDDSVTIDYSEFLPRDVVVANKAFPFEIDGNVVKVAFSDPLDEKRVNEVQLTLINKGFTMEKYFTLYSMIMAKVQDVRNVQTEYVDTAEKDTTVLVDNIVLSAISKRASDIHIEPTDTKVRIRFRIDGELVTVTELPKARQNTLAGRIKSIANMHQEVTTDQDGSINSYDNYNIRVSSQKNINGEKFVLRLLKKNSNVKNIYDLGFPRDSELVKRAFNKKNSMILMCAPTGEGKTTTLYSILDLLNSSEINIVTIENPVEIRMAGTNQVEIGHDTSFAGALRTVLRQDPNIILVGEIRDKETAQTAIEAGQTGHLVLSTIHTIDAIEAITRIRKMGVSDYDVSATLVTVISQRLVRQLCPKCKKKHQMTEKDKKYVERVEKIIKVKFDIEKADMYEPVGCEYCNNLGYYERIGIFEILCVTEELKDLISSGKSSIDIRKYAFENTDYEPLIVDGVRKVLRGITTFAELEKKIVI